MAEEKRITISRTLNGDTIYYIARNSSGTIFARELTLEKLQTAIKTYKEPPPIVEGEEEEHLPGEVAPQSNVAGTFDVPPAAHLEGEDEPKKKLLTNKLSEKVQKRKLVLNEPETAASAKKKSFWDKLK